MDNLQEYIKSQEAQIPEKVDVVIKTNEDYEKVGWIRKNLKALIKNLNDKRKSATKPLDNSKKEIMSWFEPTITKAESCDKALEQKQINYKKELEAKQFEEYKKADEKNEVAVSIEKPKVEGEKMLTYFKARIDNIELIPREYLTVTDKQVEALQAYLNKVARENKGLIDIPGVTIVEEQRIGTTKVWDL